MTEPIPFHLIFISSPVSLAAFLPLAPSPVFPSRTSSPTTSYFSTSPTRIQLLRQTAVDVRSITKRTPLLRGNNTDIWKTTQIGEATFRHDDGGAADNIARKEWMSWGGEIVVSSDEEVRRVGGFKASGLTVKVGPPTSCSSPASCLNTLKSGLSRFLCNPTRPRQGHLLRHALRHPCPPYNRPMDG